jgi:hypothetical protein
MCGFTGRLRAPWRGPADAELLAILKGLYTANASIAGNIAQPTATRLAWETALLQVINTPSPHYRRNAVAVEWALRRARDMPVY